LEEPAGAQVSGTREQAMGGLNGLAFNGLAFNGLAFNGLAFNGLALAGLSSPEFHSWFQQDPALARDVMKYLAQCALSTGQTRTYTSPFTGTTYTWEGNLGLAPDWASGAPASLDEQQLISACLAAHTNKFGVHVPISVLGVRATGEPIPYTQKELEDFPEKEACFFGNLFTDQGVFAGDDGHPLHHDTSSARACARTSEKGDDSQPCLPLVRVQLKCDGFCEKDASKTFYTRCTYDGVTYKPLTTRMRKDDLFLCGDGICQYTESCGTSDTPDSCRKDCGLCP
jgi:hypothetical protein